MTLVLPTYVASGYAGTVADFRDTKVDRSGALRMQPFVTSITAAAASDVLVGLVPFNKGFRLTHKATLIAVSDLDTDSDLTLDFGYTYYDSTLGTSDPDAFATQVTTGQAGGIITFDESAAYNWVAAADGWITMTVGVGGISYTTGVVTGQAVGCYDTAG